MDYKSYADLHESTITKAPESSMLRRRRAGRYIGSQESSTIEIVDEAHILFLNNWLHRLARTNED